MLFRLTLATLLAAASATNFSAVKRDYSGSGPQGWGVTHSGSSDFQVAFSLDGRCLDVFTGVSKPMTNSLRPIPNLKTLQWDVPVSNVHFKWISMMTSADDSGKLDISTGENCETFLMQLTSDDLLSGTCFDIEGTCLHYWQQWTS